MLPGNAACALHMQTATRRGASQTKHLLCVKAIHQQLLRRLCRGGAGRPRRRCGSSRGVRMQRLRT